MSIPGDKVMVQHTQQFSAPISDPWLFARLAVQQALSEIIATGAQPCSAQLLVNLPDTEPVAARRDLQQLLDGAKHELNQHGCELLQGQVSQGAALQLGLTVNGLVAREQLLEERAARAGDCLILTKPLGTGVLLTADAQGKAQTRWLQQGLDAMLQGNTGAAEILHQHRANAVIHVAERGLLGHLLELLQWRRGHYLDGLGESVSPADTRKRCGALGASLFAEQLPLLPGAVPCLRHGLLVTPSQHSPFSSDPIMTLQNAAAWRSEPYLPLLSDPQICGGLLAAVPAEQADACLLALHAAGCDHSTIIGIVEELPVSEDHASCAPQPINLVKGGNWEKMAERYTETVT